MIKGTVAGATLIAGILACAGRGTMPSPAEEPRVQDLTYTEQNVPIDSPPTIPGTVEWRFDEPQPGWRAVPHVPGAGVASFERTTDALRVTLADGPGASGERPLTRTLEGGVYIDLPDWRALEWAEVVVRVRATSNSPSIRIGRDISEGGAAPSPGSATFIPTFRFISGVFPVVRDSQVHSYRIHLNWGSQRAAPWRRVGLWFQKNVHVQAPEPGSIEILSVHVVPAGGRATETTLQPRQMKSDLALVRRALEEAHPALYRFTSKRDLDAEFARAEATLTRPMTVLQFRRVLARVTAAIKDGHVGFFNSAGFIDYQGGEISALLHEAKQFPLVLTFESTRAFVVLNQGLDERVTPGMEVLAVNGQSVRELLERILPHLAQDGDGLTFKTYQLGISRGFFQQGGPGRPGFSEAYRLYVGDPLRFRTTLRDPLTRKSLVADLAGVTSAEAAVNSQQNQVNRDVLTGLRTLRTLGPPQSIRYLDGDSTAVLVPGYRRPSFPDFLKAAFAELRSKGTKTLIIDMRGNTGGYDVYPGLLYSYLTSTEFRTNEPSYIKTITPSYRGRSEFDMVTDPYFGSDAGIWKPDPNGGWRMTEKYPMIGVRQPSEPHFDGRVYVLIDGGTFSAGSAFCAIAEFYKRAIFIGEETGGVGGGAGGLDIGPTLPESHLHVRIPHEAEFSIFDKPNRRRGTLPTHAVMQTVDDLAKGRDTALEFTLELIRSGKGQ